MESVLSYLFYFLASIFLIYALLQFRLGIYFLRSFFYGSAVKQNSLGVFPKVTIQLPVYNEKNVVLDLLNAIENIDYPRHLLQVQILDDSTDETSSLISIFLKNNNLKTAFEHICRDNRDGYKAGALDAALKQSTGEYIAIFDADFIPPKDFLINTLPYFKNKEIAFVQTRWGHANEGLSILTKIQAFALDMHFTVEQEGRYFSGDFIQFNGTGGILKKSVIDEAGGWSSDTVTEDLDLSFRIQLLNYKGVYASDIICPAELPTTIEALRIQQTRWIGGGASCFNKLNKKVLFSSNISRSKRFFALVHLFHSSMFLFLFSMLLLSIFSSIFYSSNYEPVGFIASLIFTFSLLSLIFIYGIGFWIGNKRKIGDFPKFLFCFLLFIALNFGMSLNNIIAIINGYRKKVLVFNRTPKNKEGDKFKYLAIEKRNFINLLELVVFSSLIICFLNSIANNNYTFIFIHFFAMVGFGWVIFKSIFNLFYLKFKKTIPNYN